jgi:hypothetical protein
MKRKTIASEISAKDNKKTKLSLKIVIHYSSVYPIPLVLFQQHNCKIKLIRIQNKYIFGNNLMVAI